jgi:hypothetical protein
MASLLGGPVTALAYIIEGMANEVLAEVPGFGEFPYAHTVKVHHSMASVWAGRGLMEINPLSDLQFRRQGIPNQRPLMKADSGPNW